MINVEKFSNKLEKILDENLSEDIMFSADIHQDSTKFIISYPDGKEIHLTVKLEED